MVKLLDLPTEILHDIMDCLSMDAESLASPRLSCSILSPLATQRYFCELRFYYDADHFRQSINLIVQPHIVTAIRKIYLRSECLIPGSHLKELPEQWGFDDRQGYTILLSGLTLPDFYNLLPGWASAFTAGLVRLLGSCSDNLRQISCDGPCTDILSDMDKLAECVFMNSVAESLGIYQCPLLRGVRFDCRDLSVLARFWDMNDSTRLNLSAIEHFALTNGCDEGPSLEDIERLLQQLRQMNLLSLKLKLNTDGNQIEARLALISHHKNLTNLNLGRCDIQDGFSTVLRNLNNLKALLFIFVRISQEKDTWANIFNACLENPKLRWIHIDMIGYSDVDICGDTCFGADTFCNGSLEDILAARKIQLLRLGCFPPICEVARKKYKKRLERVSYPRRGIKGN